MDYYKLLQLDREPFSNSPDPDYFFESQQHLGCLQKLELALRLKRGLNIVIGDVGTGKTTLCRQLIRKFSNSPDFESHLILDPAFSSPSDFLKTIYEMLYNHGASNDDQSDNALKELIKQYLFSKGVDENKTLILIIDEGQKISPSCIEILRELLNYETNTFKLLQIVIFAQLEFEQLLTEHANFADRINLLHYLAPMNFKDTRKMVQHRLKLSSTTPKPKKLFTLPAMWAIYRSSRGYPRKIIHLCHQSMLAMIIQNRSQAGWAIIQSCKKRLLTSSRSRRRLILTVSMIWLVVLILVIATPRFIDQNTAPPPSAPLAYKVKPPEVEKTAEVSDSTIKTISPVAIPTSTASIDNEGDAANITSSLQETPISKKNDAVVIEETSKPGGQPTQSNPDSAMDKHQKIHPPELLGQLVVKPGDTMVGLVQTVYGTKRNSYLNAVINANPHIDNPNRIEIGDIIIFPSISIQPDIENFSCYWIVLEEFPTLPSAAHRISEITNAMTAPMQLIPNWNSESGLRYTLCVKGYFLKKSEAIKYTHSLPKDIILQYRIISKWSENTLFYSNPYTGGMLGSPTIQ